MPRPRRIDQTDLRHTIKETAWQQIAQSGAAALSLRAIGRALHITAPAIYNYYPNRDALVTALIVDAFTAMGDAQAAALQAAPHGDHPARLMALGLAYRQWAIQAPQRYQLIFGTPIPGYDAPQELTGPAAARSLVPLIRCLEAAWLDGTLRVHPDVGLPERLSNQLEGWRSLQPASHSYVLYAALVVWSRVHGLVSLEIGSQYPPCVEDISSIYQLQLERLIADQLTYK